MTVTRSLIAGACMTVAATPPVVAQEQASAVDEAMPVLEFAFEEYVTLGEAIAVGQTPRGNRRIIPITGGTFEGPGLKGTIIPGSWDWQLERPDGCTEIIADYFIRTDDGVMINVRNTGALCRGAGPVRTHPVFEAPTGPYDWLNRAAFVGTLDLVPDASVPTIRIRFYKLN